MLLTIALGSSVEGLKYFIKLFSSIFNTPDLWFYSADGESSWLLFLSTIVDSREGWTTHTTLARGNWSGTLIEENTTTVGAW